MSLIDLILEHIPHDTFTDSELFLLLKGTPASRHNLLKRASKPNGCLMRLRRGLYQLAPRYQRSELNVLSLAQKIYSPSYVSLESALSFHGLIPEAVYAVTSASLNRSKTFKTPVGQFVFSQVPQGIFYLGVERIKKDKTVYLMASPAKALADYICKNQPPWTRITDLLESLRIERRDLQIHKSEIGELIKNYKSKQVQILLSDLKRI